MCLSFGHQFGQGHAKAHQTIKLQLQHNRICMHYKDVMTMEDLKLNTRVIWSWWLYSIVAIEEGLLGLFEWLRF